MSKNTKHVLINKSNTGFGLSYEAHELFLKLSGRTYYEHIENNRPVYVNCTSVQYKAALGAAKTTNDVRAVNASLVYSPHDISRDNPVLVEVAKQLGLNKMGDKYSKLEFVEIPADTRWSIKEINEIEYLVINPNKKKVFTGKQEHWYPVSFQPEWMEDPEELVIVNHVHNNGVDLHTSIHKWVFVTSGLFDNEDNVLWYPLTKLCPNYNAN